MSLILLIFGSGLAYLLSPALSLLMAMVTFWAGVKFLKWRVDPADMFFWMKGKPSWTAVGLTFLSGFLLVLITVFIYIHNSGNLISPFLNNKEGWSFSL